LKRAGKPNVKKPAFYDAAIIGLMNPGMFKKVPVLVYWNIPSPEGGEYGPMSFGGNMIRA
jgi:hypothetical protein